MAIWPPYDMNRAFLSNILFVLGINLLIKPLYLFGIDRNVQNTLSDGDYGLFAQILSLCYLFQIIADFGIQNYNNRQVAQYRHLVFKYFGSLASLKALLGLFFALVVGLVAWGLGYFVEHPWLVSLLIINQLLLSYLLFLRSNISGLGFYRIDSGLSVLDKLLMIFLLAGPLWLGWRRDLASVEGFALAQSVSLLISVGVAWFFLRKQALRFRWNFDRRLLLVILRQTYPYALVVLLMTLYTRIDFIMIGQLLPNGNLAADDYAAAYRLLDAANMFGYLFAGLLLPMFARQIRLGESVRSLVRLGIQLIWAGAIPLAAVLIVFRTEVMTLLYDNGDAYQGSILAWLMLSFLAVTGSYIYGTLLTAHGSLMAMNRIFSIGVLLNIVGNYFAIRSQGALGAAVVTCATQFFVFIAQVLLAQKKLDLAWVPGLVFRMLGFALSCGMIAYFGAGWLLPKVGWSLAFLLLLFITGLLSLVFRLVDVKLALAFLKKAKAGDQ
jgi:O-antigen/teichoic acid export membrane protein